MRVKNMKSAVVAFGLVGLILCSVGSGEDLGNFEELTLRISTTAAELLAFEPVPIRITLSNETKNSISADVVIQPGSGGLDIYVSKGNGTFERFGTADWGHLDFGREMRVMRPGFRESVQGYLCYAHGTKFAEDPGQYILASPGTYRIKAVLKEREGERRVESNVLTVRAMETTGDDAAAYEFIERLRKSKDRSIYHGNFLLTIFGRHLSDTAQERLDTKEEFLSRYPESRYARYVEYSLGLTYSRRDNEEEAERGVGLLRKASRYKGFFLAEEALRALRRISSKRGAVEKAKEYQAEMASRFPNSPEGRDYLEQAYSEAQEREENRTDQAEREKQPSLLIWPLSVAGALGVVIVVALVVLLRKKASSGSK